MECTYRLVYISRLKVDYKAEWLLSYALLNKEMRQPDGVQKNHFLIQTLAIFPLELIGEVFA